MSFSNKIAKVIYGNKDYFMSIDLSKWLKARSRISSDILSATLLAKKNQNDEDVDAVLTKVIGAGIIVSGDDYFVETITSDFGTGKLLSGKTYGMYFGVKFAGDTVFREIILRVSSLKVISDGIRG